MKVEKRKQRFYQITKLNTKESKEMIQECF